MKYLLPVLLLLLAVFPACIEIDESVSVYLHSDGKLDFVGYLDDIRSNEKADAGRRKDEKEFLADFKAGKIATPALKEAGAKKIKVELIRETPPYAASVSASFDSFEPFWKLFDFNARDDGKTMKLVKDGAKRTVSFHLPALEAGKDSRGEFPKRLKLILVEGRFLSATGFTISEDGRTCALDAGRSRDLRDFSVAWTFH